MKQINIGTKYSTEIIVDKSSLAVNVGSGSLKVLATPSMIILMEKAACKCISNYLENDETSVGTELSVKHISATPVGMKVRAEAEITKINGREITFNVTAYDESGKIGYGMHKRFIVSSGKFMAKADSKKFTSIIH